jgi:hypothetical protein
VFTDNYEVHEAKKFFEVNYSSIYYIFYDVFIAVEADIRQRGMLNPQVKTGPDVGFTNYPDMN